MTLSTMRPPKLPEAVLRRFAEAAYGLTGQWAPLEGERDQNFRVTAAGGAQFVFKLCHPDEGAAILKCQAEVLEHVARVDPDLAVPRLQRALTDAALPVMTHDGQDFPVMVLSWLPGQVIGERILSQAQRRVMGAMLARLGIAMRGFVHGAPANRRLLWDTRLAGDLDRDIPRLPPEDQGLATEIMTRHRHVTLPALGRLRAQIIHGDVHPFNCLIDDSGAISGIIDFGDLVHGSLVQDLANATADFLFPGRDHEAVILDLVKGYVSVSPLDEAEVDLILDMIEVRLIMTPLIEAAKLAEGIVSTGSITVFNDRSVPLIRELRALGRDRLQDLIRRAANFPPKAAPQDTTLAATIARRRGVMGNKPYVFYDPPIHMQRGAGVWLYDSAGRRYLDCYNNVPQVGHCHPYVVEAITRQARRLNTNTRYLTDQSIDYAERLAALTTDGLSAVVFVNSGSEANDLAWRMAKAWTGKSGGMAMEFAYHGVSEAIDAFSPSNAPSQWRAPHIRLLPPPDDYRGPWRRGQAGLARNYAALADPLIADLDRAGFGLAAFMVDGAFMSNGILDVAPGYLQAVAAAVRAAGGTFIADEVQSGFGRMGTQFWGHRHHGVVPDFITIGKPAGNGHPVGAVITRPEILDHFTSLGPFFSTFGGNNVACAAGIAVLDVIRDEGLVKSALAKGRYLREGLRGLMDRHALIGDVRGVGLAIGVELVRDRGTLEPAGAEAARLVGLLRDEAVLIGGEGVYGNVLKIRPPLVFQREHADLLLQGLGRALSRL